MLSQRQFEASLRAALKASQRPDFPAPAEEDKQALDILRGALERLDANPRLVRGDPNGDFTYEDPVLAALVMAMRKQKSFGAAGKPGADLKKFNIRWLTIPIKVMLDNQGQAWEMLGRRGHAPPVDRKQTPFRVAVFGDAGYQGKAQKRILDLILGIHSVRPFHAAIHLGDIYFAGSESQVQRHFLAPCSGLLSRGIDLFSLCGNHDLYSGPASYDYLMTQLNQPGRYFHITTPHWRIVCLDTSLAADVNALKLKFRDDGNLGDEQLGWLDALLHIKDGRSLILMSHHYIVSGWENNASPKLKKQLDPMIRGKVAAWYWGHEHNCAVYDQGKHGFFGSCVGNGAFRERWSRPLPDCVAPLWFPPGKCTCYGGKGKDWQHGFLELELDQNVILETYHLEDGDKFLRQVKQDSDGTWHQAWR